MGHVEGSMLAKTYPIPERNVFNDLSIKSPPICIKIWIRNIFSIFFSIFWGILVGLRVGHPYGPRQRLYLSRFESDSNAEYLK